MDDTQPRRSPRVPAARRVRLAGTTLAAGLLAASLLTADPVPATAGATDVGPPVTDAVATGGAHTVTLPSGDTLVVTTDPSGAVRTAHPVADTGQSFLTERFGGETYVLPSTVLPTLGHGASLADYDVSALLAGRPGRKPGGGAQPHFPMHTVTITVTDTDGTPADATSLSVVNLDDSRRYGGFPRAVDGVARISVPDGHYAVMGYHFTTTDDAITSERIVFGRFTVDGADADTTLSLADANHPVSVHTPRPADTRSLDISWYGGSSDAMGLESSVSSGGGHPIYVSGSPSGVGRQHFYVHATMTSPTSADLPYLYDVEFPSDGAVGTNQHYRVTADTLATVDSRYYSDTADRAGDTVWFGALPWEAIMFRMGVPLTAPVHRTEYVSARPDLTYQEQLTASLGDLTMGGIEVSGFHRFRAGTKTSADWLRGPIAPGIPADTGVGQYRCGACRTGDTLSILLSPVTDATPDHSGLLDAPGEDTVSTSHFRLYRGDTTIADLEDTVGGNFTVPAEAADYRLVYDQTRIAPWTGQSTKSSTTWTFSSRHTTAAGVPARWACGSDATTNDCSPLSLLLPRYRLEQSMDGSVPPGPSSMVLSVTHTPGADAVPIDDATVQVSYNDGDTWTPTRCSNLGSGRFRARWTSPSSSAGGTMALRITATDANGATVTQTVHDALTISSEQGDHR